MKQKHEKCANIHKIYDTVVFTTKQSGI